MGRPYAARIHMDTHPIYLLGRRKESRRDLWKNHLLSLFFPRPLLIRLLGDSSFASLVYVYICMCVCFTKVHGPVLLFLLVVVEVGLRNIGRGTLYKIIGRGRRRNVLRDARKNSWYSRRSRELSVRTLRLPSQIYDQSYRSFTVRRTCVARESDRNRENALATVRDARLAAISNGTSRAQVGNARAGKRWACWKRPRVVRPSVW